MGCTTSTLEQQFDYSSHKGALILLTEYASRSGPGFGHILGAQPLVAAGDLRAYPSVGHLAAAAGLVPVPNDSG